MKYSLLFAAVAWAMACAPLHAQTLYKLIDKKGKITYVDTPPKDFDGQVIPLDIDKKRNTATLVNPGTPAAEQSLNEKMRASDTADQRRKQAQERLDAARKELAFARENPLEGEVDRVGTVKGGSRPVYNETYERRIAKLEEAVRVAEDEVRRAGQAR